MISLRLVDAQRAFFDRPAVLRATTDTERVVLSRFGAHVRQRARTSMRRRRESSPPGQPPSAHVGLLRQRLFFAWDHVHRSVVVGPERLNRRGRDIPPILEYGGPTTVVRRDQARRVAIAPRPFMAPAYAAEARKLPPLWRNSIR